MRAHTRYRRRVTQIEVAKLAGVKQPTVSEWQEPGRGPELKNAIRLSKSLNVCVQWIYTGEGGMRPIPEQDTHLRSLLALWGHVDERDKAKIVAYAEIAAKDAPFAGPPQERPASSRAAF